MGRDFCHFEIPAYIFSDKINLQLNYEQCLCSDGRGSAFYSHVISRIAKLIPFSEPSGGMTENPAKMVSVSDHKTFVKLFSVSSPINKTK